MDGQILAQENNAGDGFRGCSWNIIHDQILSRTTGIAHWDRAWGGGGVGGAVGGSHYPDAVPTTRSMNS